MARRDGVTNFTSFGLERLFTIGTATSSTPGTAGQALISGGENSPITWGSVGSGALPVASTSQAGIVSIGTQKFAGAKTFVNQVNLSSSSSLNAGAILALQAYGTPITSGTAQSGFEVNGPFNSTGATTAIQGLRVALTGTAGSYTTGSVVGIRLINTTAGAGQTITRSIGIRADAQTGGTNNATLSDNVSFTGNWFINSTSTNPSLLSGAVTLGASGSTQTHIANGVFEVYSDNASSSTFPGTSEKVVQIGNYSNAGGGYVWSHNNDGQGTAFAHLSSVGAGNDGGSNPMFLFEARTWDGSTAGSISTRPLFQFANNTTILASLTASGAWTFGPSAGGVTHRINTNTQTTVGAAGAASALPANPTGYITININGTDRVIPYYAAS